MGVFDYLTVEYPLPDGFDARGVDFQTKDTDEQWLVRYVLRADGTLWNTKAGAIEEAHGAVEFYASNWGGSCGRLYMTSDDLPPWRAEYEALFDHGKLLKIEGPGYHLIEDVEHVLSGDFDRRCKEMKATTAKPGDDLHKEWVHWMAGIHLGRKGLFEEVKLPALGVRLHHLWSRGAWGLGDRSYIQELREWSGWLSGEDPATLTPDVASLLERTQAFLGSLPETQT